MKKYIFYAVLLISFTSISFAGDFNNCIRNLPNFNSSASYQDDIEIQREGEIEISEEIYVMAQDEGISLCTKTTDSKHLSFYASGDSGKIQNFYYEIKAKFSKTR